MDYKTPDGVSIHDGFPNAAADMSLQLLDLNKLLIRHRISTYFMRISDSDWQEQGIFKGDLVIVNRALKPRLNDLVIWWEAERFIISPKHSVPVDTPTWGVVTATIHQFREQL